MTTVTKTRPIEPGTDGSGPLVHDSHPGDERALCGAPVDSFGALYCRPGGPAHRHCPTCEVERQRSADRAFGPGRLQVWGCDPDHPASRAEAERG